MLRTLYLLLSFLIFSGGCSKKWTQAIRKGSIQQKDFREEVSLEVKRGLYFLPVIIEGVTYRFLLDTGAPFSISEALQNSLLYKTVSKGKIVDSDHNRKEVNWVQVDSLKLGEVTFLNQTAFVGDFNANPIMACLGIDGIIGSNILRQANWEFNPASLKLTCTSQSLEEEKSWEHSVAFSSDVQYDMFVDIQSAGASINHVLVDFGSNGSLNLDKSIFEFLEEKNLVRPYATETGFQQSGIVGKVIPLERKIAKADSIWLGNQLFENVSLKTGKTTSIGTGFLSNCTVGIDWQKRQLLFKDYQNKDGNKELLGLTLGLSDQNKVFIRSITSPSVAAEAGLKVGMEVVQVGAINFEKGGSYCDYVQLEINDPLELIVKGEDGALEHFLLKR